MFDFNHSGSPIDPKTMVLIWDTGASAGLTPFRSDFIDYVEVDFEVRDVTKANKVKGIGTTLHKFVDNNGKNVYLPCVSYHLPTTDVRLFSPQIYHQLHGGSSTIDGANVCLRLRGRHHNITIPIVCGGTNLPCDDDYGGAAAEHDRGVKDQMVLSGSKFWLSRTVRT